MFANEIEYATGDRTVVSDSRSVISISLERGPDL